MERKIRLNVNSAKDFVARASQCDFDIDVFYNHYIVDAKSILGVFALDFAKDLTVRYEGYNEDFENFLKCLALAC